jgi:hypothetical protein
VPRLSQRLLQAKAASLRLNLKHVVARCNSWLRRLRWNASLIGQTTNSTLTLLNSAGFGNDELLRGQIENLSTALTVARMLVTTDRLSEGVDLHRCCRHLIHYELDPSPVRTLQRNGRVRRVVSWAAVTSQPICYAYPTFGGTRDEKAVAVMKQRINTFGLLLGGVPSVGDDSGDSEQSFVEEVLRRASNSLASLNRKLCV